MSNREKNLKSTFRKYPVYKDSGVEWIGEIPEGWEVKRFKFLSSIQKGKLPKKIVSQNNQIDLPVYMSMEYLRGGEETQWVLDKNAVIINEGEILLLWDGSNAGEFLKSRKGVISSTVAVIYIKGINHQYTWYYSKILEFELKKNTIGMGIPHVSSQYINNLMVLLPSLTEQTAIANFLDNKTVKIDKAIAQKEKMIALLKERKQIIIQNAVTKGLDPNVKMKDSGVEWIGEIPEHWQINKCKYLFFEVNERSATGKEELLSVSHVTGITLRSEKNVNMFLAEDYSGSKLCRKGDVVFNTMWAWMGALGVSKTIGIVSSSYGIYRLITDKIFNHLYLEELLKSSEYITHYNRVSTGLHTSRLRFYSHMFFDMKIGFAPKNEQDNIMCYIKKQSTKIDKAIHLQQQQIEKLKEYKTILINDAVTGKIKVC